MEADWVKALQKECWMGLQKLRNCEWSGLSFKGALGGLTAEKGRRVKKRKGHRRENSKEMNQRKTVDLKGLIEWRMGKPAAAWVNGKDKEI